MRTGSKRMLGLALAAALALSACTGDDGDADQPEDAEVSIPPVESSDSGDGSVDGDGNGRALDLDSMTDDELLAEAERTYLGFLYEVDALRARGSNNYEEIDEWVTEAFRAKLSERMNSLIPEGYRIENGPVLLWVELSQEQVAGEVRANVCVDNSRIRVFDADDKDVTNPQTNEVGFGTVRFVVGDDLSHLLVDEEILIESEETRPCSLD